MPVKNTKRRTNDGLEGVITGLTEEEKKILNEAISGGALLVDTVDEMNALLEEKDLKDGQLCYCKETTTLYVLENNTWVEVGGGNTIIFTCQDNNPPAKSYWTNNNNENLNKLNKALEKRMNIAIYCYTPYETSKQPYKIYRLGGFEGFSSNKIYFVQDKLYPNNGAGIGGSSGNPSTAWYNYYSVNPETGETYLGYQLINTLAMDVGNMVGVNKNGEFLRLGNGSGNSGYLGIPNKKGRDLTEGTYSYKLTVDSSGNRTYDWVKDN